MQNQVKKHMNAGVPFEDLYQEGCYGLIRAIDMYEYRPDTTFDAFAWHYINKYIKKALVQQSGNSPMAFSEEYYFKLRRYQQKYREMKTKLGRPPNNQEMSEALNLSMICVRRLNSVLFQFVYIDEDIVSDPDQPKNPQFRDIISSTPNTPRPTEDAAISVIFNEESELFHTLTPTEREVILRRIGMTESGEPETYPRISADLKISKETARRAFSRGINKIRLVIDID